MELTRRWLVADWLIRAVAPRWLRSVGLADHAHALSDLAALGSPEALARAAPAVEIAADAVRGLYERTWYYLVEHAQLHSSDPVRSHLWQALVDGAQAAAASVRLVLDPAAHAVGYPPDSDRGPAAWSAAVAAITDAAGALTWSAIASIPRWTIWSPHLPVVTARGLAYATARAALGPAEASTQAAAGDLLTAMFTITPTREETR